MASLTVDSDDPTSVTVPGFVDQHGTNHPPITLTDMHTAVQCVGPSCIIHRPSAHHMLTWPLAWHEAAEILIRLCPHWVMHPDPDGWGPLIHLCDGCCDLNYRQRPSLPVHQIQSD